MPSAPNGSGSSAPRSPSSAPTSTSAAAPTTSAAAPTTSAAAPTTSAPDPNASVPDESGVSASVESNADTSKDEFEKKAGELINKTRSQIKTNPEEQATGIMNLLNVLSNNVKKLNNFLYRKAANNTESALYQYQQAKNESEKAPGNDELRDKARKAQENLDKAIKKGTNFYETMTRPVPKEGWAAKLGSAYERTKVTAPEIAGAAYKGMNTPVLKAGVYGVKKAADHFSKKRNEARDTGPSTSAPRGPRSS